MLRRMEGNFLIDVIERKSRKKEITKQDGDLKEGNAPYTTRSNTWKASKDYNNKEG